MPSYRSQKINEEFKRELSNILREVKDPRIPDMVSVVKVEVTKDLKFAKAYISVFGDEEKKKNAISGLQSAQGFIKREIGSRLNLRGIPQFTFVLDDSIEYGAHIIDLINKTKGQD
ncbi:30S ribosome-binding factor RbfA [Acetivibrio sp. MSJd-27]|jgi:ribosome-binding factor A|uniref:30S ribosome-binding factor RbfA n=1 Tax=Acetivibrio sp. MSJd-27 TaxID=2841523 RepID=UPI0015AE365C|nr:30S ribosome-binding factor RbfA [Acetivibrio sp. MSJd-27]MBU5450937.1 30S ribosome-binding factor RbfA [Acetivibrio sp. MSJd-27]